MDDRNLVLSTDFPLDKIIGTYQDSFSVAAVSGFDLSKRSTYTISTDIGGETLPIGVYSYDNAIWYPLNVARIKTSSGFPDLQTVEVSCYTTPDDLVVVATNYETTGYTIYFKIEVISP